MPQVHFSTRIAAPVDAVWRELRDFGRLADWHPLIADCRIENDDPGDRVGCVRRFHLADGSLFREQLLALDDLQPSLAYGILESPLSLENYVATIKLLPVTDDDSTLVTWSSSFECPADSEAELRDLVQNSVYRTGLDAIRQRLTT